MMLSNSKQKLLTISGPALINRSPVLSSKSNSCLEELIELLKRKNGFYAFEAALQVYPSSLSEAESLENWNKLELWRFAYPDLSSEILFFAQDVFGGQFGILGASVQYFEPETGELTFLAKSLEEFVKKLLVDYENLTGYPLAHEWQQKNGQIQNGMRLAPKIPFILGGDYSVDNLYAAGQVDLMKARGHIAQQIARLPDGAAVEIKTI